MSNERVFYQPAGKRRRTTSRILSLLIVVAELGASALPIVDADFPPPGEKPMPYVACVGLIVVFIAGNCCYVAKRGTLPGLTSLGVAAVRMRDGGNAGVLAIQKYAVEAAVTLATLVVGLPFILHFTSDRFGRTWFDRVGGIIYVDTRRPIEDDDEFGAPSAASAEFVVDGRPFAGGSVRNVGRRAAGRSLRAGVRAGRPRLLQGRRPASGSACGVRAVGLQRAGGGLRAVGLQRAGDLPVRASESSARS